MHLLSYHCRFIFERHISSIASHPCCLLELSRYAAFHKLAPLRASRSSHAPGWDAVRNALAARRWPLIDPSQFERLLADGVAREQVASRGCTNHSHSHKLLPPPPLPLHTLSPARTLTSLVQAVPGTGIIIAGKDDLYDLLIPQYTKSFFHLLQRMEELAYNNQAWGDAEVRQCAAVLSLSRVEVHSKIPSRVKLLQLDENKFGDLGLTALAATFSGGALANLQADEPAREQWWIASDGAVASILRVSAHM